MANKITLVPKILETVEKLGDVLKILQAALKGFDVFQKELKDGDNETK